jgi:hypothetical protein
MNKPVRIQLRRTRGWRMPADAKSVARPHKWGNPYRVILDQMRPNGDIGEDNMPVMMGPWLCKLPGDRIEGWWFPTKAEAQQKAVDLYRNAITTSSAPGWAILRDAVLDDLRWKNLACWCGADEPCHADVLIELANRRIKP